MSIGPEYGLPSNWCRCPYSSLLWEHSLQRFFWFFSLYEVYLPYDPVFPSVDRSVLHSLFPLFHSLALTHISFSLFFTNNCNEQNKKIGKEREALINHIRKCVLNNMWFPESQFKSVDVLYHLSHLSLIRPSLPLPTCPPFTSTSTFYTRWDVSKMHCMCWIPVHRIHPVGRKVFND